MALRRHSALPFRIGFLHILENNLLLCIHLCLAFLMTSYDSHHYLLLSPPVTFYIVKQAETFKLVFSVKIQLEKNRTWFCAELYHVSKVFHAGRNP